MGKSFIMALVGLTGKMRITFKQYALSQQALICAHSLKMSCNLYLVKTLHFHIGRLINDTIKFQKPKFISLMKQITV